MDEAVYRFNRSVRTVPAKHFVVRKYIVYHTVGTHLQYTLLRQGSGTWVGTFVLLVVGMFLCYAWCVVLETQIGMEALLVSQESLLCE
jgi:hypothetical protein